MNDHRRPGRPQIADPVEIGKAAVALFHEHGYAAVSMDDVAARTGVSRRTLFRHFANKADLVWHEFFATYRRLDEALSRDSAQPGMIGLRAAMREVLAPDAVAEEAARVRLRIIGESPEVFAAGMLGLVDITDRLARHLARADGLEEGGLDAHVAGQAATGAILSASVWWAQHSNEPVSEVVDRALARLEAGIP